MPVKFECPKCQKRFIDWGAEKLGYKCPDYKDKELVKVGAASEVMSAAPSLKRPKIKVTVPADDDLVDDDISDEDTISLDDDDDEGDDDDESGGLMSDGGPVSTSDDEDSSTPVKVNPDAIDESVDIPFDDN